MLLLNSCEPLLKILRGTSIGYLPAQYGPISKWMLGNITSFVDSEINSLVIQNAFSRNPLTEAHVMKEWNSVRNSDWLAIYKDNSNRDDRKNWIRQHFWETSTYNIRHPDPRSRGSVKFPLKKWEEYYHSQYQCLAHHERDWFYIILIYMDY